MKIFLKGDNFIIYKIKNNSDIEKLNKEDIELNIKSMLNYIKKRYKKNISGFYNVILYKNNKYGLIFEINKESDLDFFPDVIDIKLKIEDNLDIYLKFDDYFLINNYNVYYYNNLYYVNINDICDKDIILLSDYYNIVYGKELKKIENKLKIVN